MVGAPELLGETSSSARGWWAPYQEGGLKIFACHIRGMGGEILVQGCTLKT